MIRSIGTSIRRQWMGALALFLVVAGGGAYAAFDPVGPDGDIDACYAKKSGDLDVRKGKKCGKGEKPLAWGQVGPRGEPGPATGPAGGDLTGSYPNPEIANGSVTAAKLADDVAVKYFAVRRIGGPSSPELVRASPGVTLGTEGSEPGVNFLTVNFPTNIADCVAVANQGGDNTVSTPVVPLETSLGSSSVRVIVNNTSPVPAFSLLVVC